MRRQRVVFRWAHAASAVASAVAALLAAPAARAGAVTDGSAGAVQTLSGNFALPQSLGTVRGTNLFHSFSRFSVAAGESATFTTTDPGLRNVISRVTGGEASIIQGLLRLEAAAGSAPAFYFINPSGITIGAGGVVDVPGALHLSTAPLLNFGDGFVLDARTATASTFTVAAPESFGFVGSQAAAALRLQDAFVPLRPGGAFTLAAGALAIERTLLVTQGAPIGVQAASLDVTSAPGFVGGFVAQPGPAGSGSIDLRISGDAALSGGSLVLAGSQAGNAGRMRVAVGGTLQVLGGSSIVSIQGGAQTAGALTVDAGAVTLDGPGSSISTLAVGTAPAAALLQLTATGRLQLGPGTQVTSYTLGTGRGGTLDVTAGSIDLRGAVGEITGLSTASLAAGAGHAGPVTVRAGTLTLRSGAQVASVSNSDAGNAGDVTVQVDRLVIDGAGLDTEIQSFARSLFGSAGAVRIRATGDIAMFEGAGITAGAAGFGSSGSVDVRAASVLVDGRGNGNAFTGIGGGALGGASASAPPVNIEAGDVLLRQGAAVTSLTATAADAGTVRIVADRLVLDANNTGAPTIIATNTVGTGNAGLIDLRVGELRVVNGAALATSTQSAGRGGGIRIEGRSVTVDGGIVSADAFAGGDAGSITLVAGDLLVTRAGTLSSSTRDTARGGTIGVTAQTVTVDEAGGIFTVAFGTGNAGRMTFDVSGAMRLLGGGRIVANTVGTGAGGQVDIRAGALTVSGQSANGFQSGIASRALPGSGGQPGNVTIDVAGAFEVRDGGIVNIANEAQVADPAAVATTTLGVRAGEITLVDGTITAASAVNANAGRIELVTPGRLRIERSSISTSAVDGDGGPITISAGRFVRLADSSISTSVFGSTNGNGGDITVRSGALALSSGFIQANTAAPLARGGRVTVDVGLLVPDGSNVFVGGNRIAAFRTGLAGFNVVQAAAPDGVAGQLDVTIPELNLAGSLAGLATPPIDFGPLARDWCEPGDAPLGANLRAADAPRLGEAGRRQSTLTVLGRGAVRAPASGPLGITP